MCRFCAENFQTPIKEIKEDLNNNHEWEDSILRCQISPKLSLKFQSESQKEPFGVCVCDSFLWVFLVS